LLYPAAGGTAVKFYELRDNLRRWRALRVWGAPHARTGPNATRPAVAAHGGSAGGPKGRWFKSSRPDVIPLSEGSRNLALRSGFVCEEARNWPQGCDGERCLLVGRR
jgi:hypothetical protein